MLPKEQISLIKKSIGRDNNRLPILFNALSDPRRFRIFKLLVEHTEVCVTDVANIFGVTVSSASQHLRILEMTGLITKERMGQSNCYEIRKDDPLVAGLIKMFS